MQSAVRIGHGKEGKEASGQPTSRRGRPAKFGRPARLVAVTLPQDVIDRLRSQDSDLGRAIVRMVETANPTDQGNVVAEGEAVVELARLPRKCALIVAQESLVQHLPEGITTIPLSQGRALLAFSASAGIADLELAVLDRISTLPPDSSARGELTEVREKLRSWRLDSDLRFTSKSILVAEHARPEREERNERGGRSGPILDLLRSAAASMLAWMGEVPSVTLSPMGFV